jgi:large subunit ribosomal protein L31
MKANIHPTYHQIDVTCSCGAVFVTGSTKDSMTVDICAKCHPFFTGEQRFVDKVGRVQKFQTKQANATGKKTKKDRKSAQTGPTSLSELRAASK